MKIIKNKDIVPKSRKGKGLTKYQFILASLQVLRRGQALIVSLDADTSPRQFYTRLNATKRRYGIVPPKGCRFRAKTTIKGEATIQCLLK